MTALESLVTAVVLLVVVLVLGLLNSYLPMSARARAALRAATLYHFVEDRHLVHRGEGEVEVRPSRRRWHTNLLLPRRDAVSYYYTAGGRRGGRLNHLGRSRRAYSLLVIDGADFEAHTRDRTAWRRPYDRAIAVTGGYTGPGRVRANVHPYSARDCEP